MPSLLSGEIKDASGTPCIFMRVDTSDQPFIDYNSNMVQGNHLVANSRFANSEDKFPQFFPKINVKDKRSEGEAWSCPKCIIRKWQRRNIPYNCTYTLAYVNVRIVLIISFSFLFHILRVSVSLFPFFSIPLAPIYPIISLQHCVDIFFFLFLFFTFISPDLRVYPLRVFPPSFYATFFSPLRSLRY